jgi:pSer/pThr/pTyr-binding forkhead associated (FHA) protein
MHLMTPVSPAPAFVPSEHPPAPLVQTAPPAVAHAQLPLPSSARMPVAPPVQPAAPPGREARMLRGFLVPLQGRPTQEYWALHGTVATVGRANTGDHVDVAVLDSTTSSRHAALHFDSARGIVYVEDLGSTNGTFVNDVPIGHNGRRELRDNDRVRFGGFSALLKLLPLL